jgi:hypothetical protein
MSPWRRFGERSALISDVLTVGRSSPVFEVEGIQESAIKALDRTVPVTIDPGGNQARLARSW